LNDPKSFSRKLDSLLTKIGKDATHENFISSIMDNLVENFGKELQIVDGSIYDHRGKEFILVYSLSHNKWSDQISLDSEAIQLINKHGSYIFDSLRFRQYFWKTKDSIDLVPAAVTINTPERQLLIVFGLQTGWTREEISLFINAFQMALTFRLFSDMMDSELQKTVQIQKSLLPRHAPKIPGYDLSGRSVPAILVGGDFYEYFESDEGHFGISIGDASGHGLPAALLVRDVVVGLRMGLISQFKLAHIVKNLNQVIQKSTFASNFVSLVLGEFERDGHFFYVNAGHPAPFVLKDEEIIELSATGMVIGFMKKADIQRAHVQLKPGSIMVLYTDGIIERQNIYGEQYDVYRLHEIVKKNRDKSAEEIIDEIFTDVYKFGSSVNWEDDASVVIIKRL
jgi:sigma-B regulation protein RsbU (phosphoserine phosphatase)